MKNAGRYTSSGWESLRGEVEMTWSDAAWVWALFLGIGLLAGALLRGLRLA